MTHEPGLNSAPVIETDQASWSPAENTMVQQRKCNQQCVTPMSNPMHDDTHQSPVQVL